MGFEYRFRISADDHESLGRNPDGVDTLDKLLLAGPHYLGKKDNVYSYNADASEGWSSTIAVDETGLCLCIYNRSANSADRRLMDYLYHALLERCGRVEVEDA